MTYTVVRHSGFGYQDDPRFERAVESRALDTRSQERLVLQAGGLVFPSYEAAERYCENENYPAGTAPDEIIPKVPGRFADAMVDGLEVYVP